MKNGIEDIELWKSFKDGQQTAFSLLYRRYVTVLYKYGLKITPDNELVEDVIQDLFVDLWKSKENLTDPDSVKYYLFTILRRKIVRCINASGNIEQLDDENQKHIVHVESVEHLIVNEEESGTLVRSIQHAVSNLPTRQQEVINLRYFHNFSHPEISEMMGISLQSVHNTLQKAMKSLQQQINPNIDLVVILSMIFCSDYNV
ncbi:RNA polymerase sigma factor [Dyadobacter sp. 3J3]|uniref:RNA polymerase sigma factor n=1 Tax=Dyadobacter sp. 3J3 TaxID=2606600 RepID=UPI00135A21E8|nr:sigma-70 family RNA polymerase sigma factor [Dyadobacter sp. 3J3]